jgi:hypothetical protein
MKLSPFPLDLANLPDKVRVIDSSLNPEVNYYLDASVVKTLENILSFDDIGSKPEHTRT